MNEANSTDSEMLVRLKARDELYWCALVAANVGVWEWDPTTNCFMSHQILRAMLGYEATPLVSSMRDWLEVVHALDRKNVEACLVHFLNGHSNLYEHCHRLVHSDGTVRLVLSRALVVERCQGRPTRIIGADIDITDAPRPSTLAPL